MPHQKVFKTYVRHNSALIMHLCDILGLLKCVPLKKLPTVLQQQYYSWYLFKCITRQQTKNNFCQSKQLHCMCSYCTIFNHQEFDICHLQKYIYLCTNCSMYGETSKTCVIVHFIHKVASQKEQPISWIGEQTLMQSFVKMCVLKWLFPRYLWSIIADT